MTLPIWFIDNIFKQNQKSVVGTSITVEDPYKVAWIMGDDNNDIAGVIVSNDNSNEVV